jgi:hypothetical protein
MNPARRKKIEMSTEKPINNNGLKKNSILNSDSVEMANVEDGISFLSNNSNYALNSQQMDASKIEAVQNRTMFLNLKSKNLKPNGAYTTSQTIKVSRLDILFCSRSIYFLS